MAIQTIPFFSFKSVNTGSLIQVTLYPTGEVLTVLDRQAICWGQFRFVDAVIVCPGLADSVVAEMNQHFKQYWE